MSRESYSQEGEDLIIAALFPEPGRLIDIGAWEPCEFSNSRLLIERGWEATLVEFSPGPLAKLIREYAGNPKVRVVAAAVVPGAGGMEKFRVTDDGLSVPSSDEEHRIRWESYAGGYYGEVWVPTIDIRQLMERFTIRGAVDYVSVDTEGSSVEIAMELMKDEDRPRVICCEYDDRIDDLMEYAKRCRYREEWRNGVNVVLARE